MASNRNVMFFVRDPFGNRVVLYEKTWDMHTSPRHEEDLPDLGDVRASILDPDQLRRSLAPVVGNDTCLFEKFIGPEKRLLRTPVIYTEGIVYEAGGSDGHVTSSFYPDPPFNTCNVGEIFWTKTQDAKGGKQ